MSSQGNHLCFTLDAPALSKSHFPMKMLDMLNVLVTSTIEDSVGNGSGCGGLSELGSDIVVGQAICPCDTSRQAFCQDTFWSDLI